MQKIWKWFVNCFNFTSMTDRNKKDCGKIVEELGEVIEDALDIIETQSKTILRQAKVIDRLTKPQLQHTILTLNINNQQGKFIIMALQLIANGLASAGTLIFRDADTLIEVPATFANTTVSRLDPAVATASVTDAGHISVIPVAPGTSTLDVSSDITYTDPQLGSQTVTKLFSIDVTVVAQPTLEHTELIVVFGPQA